MTPELPREKARRLIAAVAARTGVGIRDVTGPSRLPHIVAARHAAIAAVVDTFPGVGSVAVGRLFHKHYSTIIAALDAPRRRRISMRLGGSKRSETVVTKRQRKDKAPQVQGVWQAFRKQTARGSVLFWRMPEGAREPQGDARR